MGLFDKLVKTINDSGLKDEFQKIGKEIEKSVKDSNGKPKPTKEVPSDYSHFPQFDGEISDLSVKNIDKYHRCTIDYKESSIEAIDAYRDKVVSEGYIEATDVRYEKGNEYIIIDPDDKCMHLVFHVKH